MDWTSPFIVYRITPDGKLEEVFHATDLKKAKYWLTYIAQPGDVLCKTPAHPKHSGQSKAPEYWCHKAMNGAPLAEQKAWQKILESRSCNLVMPEEQLKTPEA